MMSEEAIATHYSEFAKRAIEEHHLLGQARSRLRKLLEAFISHPGREKRSELLHAFREFRGHLLEHMEFEEKEGFMSPILEVRPHLGNKVERLLADHKTLRVQLDRDLRILESGSEFAYPVMDIVLSIADMLDFIEAHEREENTMVLETFCQDTGTKD
jgi:hypothetical protein